MSGYKVQYLTASKFVRRPLGTHLPLKVAITETFHKMVYVSYIDKIKPETYIEKQSTLCQNAGNASNYKNWLQKTVMLLISYTSSIL